MAAIPDNILNSIKCSECTEYISYPPVYTKKNSNNICGRCEIPRNLRKNMARNKLFEEVAPLLIFPCRYVTRGCQTQLKWGESREHEKNCKYNNIVIISCPSLPTGKCTWSGPYTKVLEHFKTEHAELVITHPYKITPYQIWIVNEMKKLLKVSFKNFLMVAHGYLFVVQFKICFQIDIIWLCVSFIGDPKLCAHFECFVQLESKIPHTGDKIMIDQILTKVTALDEKKSFKLSLGKDKYTVSINLNCIKCKNCHSSFSKLDSDQNKFCCDEWDFVRDEKSLSKRTWHQCMFHDKGCSYTDVIDNVLKHQIFSCKFSVIGKCPDCPNFSARKSKESLIDHLKKLHFSQHFPEYLDLAIVYMKLYETCNAVIETDKGMFFCTWGTKVLVNVSYTMFGIINEETIFFFVKIFSDLPATEEKNINFQIIFKENRTTCTVKEMFHEEDEYFKIWMISFKLPSFVFNPQLIYSLRIEIVA